MSYPPEFYRHRIDSERPNPVIACLIYGGSAAIVITCILLVAL